MRGRVRERVKCSCTVERAVGAGWEGQRGQSRTVCVPHPPAPYPPARRRTLQHGTVQSASSSPWRWAVGGGRSGSGRVESRRGPQGQSVLSVCVRYGTCTARQHDNRWWVPIPALLVVSSSMYKTVRYHTLLRYIPYIPYIPCHTYHPTHTTVHLIHLIHTIHTIHPVLTIPSSLSLSISPGRGAGVSRTVAQTTRHP